MPSNALPAGPETAGPVEPAGGVLEAGLGTEGEGRIAGGAAMQICCLAAAGKLRAGHADGDDGHVDVGEDVGGRTEGHDGTDDRDENRHDDEGAGAINSES